MTVSVRLAPPEVKLHLREIMQDYLAELSRYGEVNADYPHLDAYWHDDDRWPYLIEVDDQLAGLALVNKWSPSHQGTDFAVAEFYILPDFRHAGVGGRAFAALLQNHKGVWELSVMSRNETAKSFWRHTICTANVRDVERLVLGDEIVYRFATQAQDNGSKR